MSTGGRDGGGAFGLAGTADLAGALNSLLADAFALHLKTKNFHWHMSGPQFRDRRLLLDAQARQLLAIADPLAERVRQLGGTTLRSISHVARLQRVLDSDADHVTPPEMLKELHADTVQYAARLRAAHSLCAEHGDLASAALIVGWIDEAEHRAWFLLESGRPTDCEF